MEVFDEIRLAWETFESECGLDTGRTQGCSTTGDVDMGFLSLPMTIVRSVSTPSDDFLRADCLFGMLATNLCLFEYKHCSSFCCLCLCRDRITQRQTVYQYVLHQSSLRLLQNELSSLLKPWKFQNKTNVFINNSDQTERQRWSNRTGISHVRERSRWMEMAH